MDEQPSNTLLPSGLPAKFGWLALAVALAWCLAAGWAWPVDGSLGLAAATLAATVCLAASSLSLLLAGLLRGPELAQVSILAGMFLRMGLPLALVVVSVWRGGPLTEAGVVYYTLGFYLLTLVVETVLSLSLVESTPADRSARNA
jgi:hypothetical protein